MCYKAMWTTEHARVTRTRQGCTGSYSILLEHGTALAFSPRPGSWCRHQLRYRTLRPRYFPAWPSPKLSSTFRDLPNFPHNCDAITMTITIWSSALFSLRPAFSNFRCPCASSHNAPSYWYTTANGNPKKPCSTEDEEMVIWGKERTIGLLPKV